MFKWYFQPSFIENSWLFYISLLIIILIILITIYLVYKSIKEDDHVNK